jgi:uncharacterized lipoprotein YehR (DUF1307 family)
MKISKTLTVSILTAGLALLLGGCGASQQSRSMEIKDSLLVNPAILEKSSGDEALYRYFNPKTDIKSYSKVMVDPVIMSKAASLDAKETENYQKLVNNAYVFLTDELKKDYTLVQTPEPGTLRFQMAIISADSSKPVRTLMSTVMPIGLGISLVKYTATGTPMSVGDITAEMKVTDAATGELVFAGVDKRVGGINIQGAWDSWMTADDGLKYWAKRAAFVLCQKRGGAACVKP